MTLKEKIKDFVFIIVLVLVCLNFVLFLSVLEEGNRMISRSVGIADISDTTSLKLKDGVNVLRCDSIITDVIVINPVVEVPVVEYRDIE